MLEGSVRKAGGRVRIAGQLIEAATEMHLWADHFDGTLDDIFDLQDKVTSSVVGAIAPSVTRAEMERAKRKPPDNLNAYDCFLRGQWAMWRNTKDGTDEAINFYEQAVALDSQFAAAYAGVASGLNQRINQQWSASSSIGHVASDGMRPTRPKPEPGGAYDAGEDRVGVFPRGRRT